MSVNPIYPYDPTKFPGSSGGWGLSTTISVVAQPRHLPLKITREKNLDGALVCVEDTASGVFGVGADLAAALADFQSALSNFRDVLEEQAKLSTALTRMLADVRRAIEILG